MPVYFTAFMWSGQDSKCAIQMTEESRCGEDLWLAPTVVTDYTRIQKKKKKKKERRRRRHFTAAGLYS